MPKASSLRSSRAALAPGARVAVVAPGFAVKRAPVEAGLRWLGRRGYDVRPGEHLFDRQGYLAGNDDDRTADLVGALTDPDVDAIWFARGGYGTARLLDRLPWRRLRRGVPLLIGFSDLTALFAAIDRKVGGRCLYGPVVTELGERSAWHAPSLLAGLRGERFEQRLAARQVLVPGRARGRLVGGNLVVLNHLCGTRFMPDLRGRILFLEEIGEGTYRIDRMLNQLRQSGAFRGLAGVVLGGFQVPPRHRFPPDRELDELFEEIFRPLGVPVVRSIRAGHVPAKRTLPLGDPCRIDTRARRVVFGR